MASPLAIALVDVGPRLGKRHRESSWVVRAKTGRPTVHAPAQFRTELETRPAIISDPPPFPFGGLREPGGFAMRDLISPALDHLKRAMFLEQYCHHLGVPRVIFLVGRRNRTDATINI